MPEHGAPVPADDGEIFGVGDKRHVTQGFGGDRLTVADEVPPPWRGDEQELLVDESKARDPTKPGTDRADDDVESSDGQIDEQLLGQTEGDPELDVLIGHLSQERDHADGHVLRRSADVDDTSLLRGEVPVPVGDGIEAVDVRGDLRSQRLRPRRRRDAAPMSLEQRIPELPFERLHLARDGRLTQSDELRCGRERPHPEHRDEGAEIVEARLHLDHTLSPVPFYPVTTACGRIEPHLTGARSQRPGHRSTSLPTRSAARLLSLERAGRECSGETVSLGQLRSSAPLRSGTSSDQLASTGSTRAVGESGSTV